MSKRSARETRKIAELGLEPRIAELLTMLTYRRPSGGHTEEAFIKRFLLPLGVLPDEYGNHWLTVGNGSPILWSSHTDTVHKDEGTQRILYGHNVVTVEGSNCLGADCTVGVWLMMHMIRAGVPGTYIFHCDEEVGGHGSDYIAKDTPNRLEGIKYAIAFDRKGYSEIITHQMGMRCASEAFASSLADVLHPLPYSASDNGTFTDTANYMSIVPECVNIAVGYDKQHTKGESLDVRFACSLLDKLLTADWSTLVCERDPADMGFDDDWWSRDPWADRLTSHGAGYHGFNDDARDPLLAYVRANPRNVACFLDAMSVTVEEIEACLHDEPRRRKAA